MSEKKRFSLVARARSFNHAFRGIGIVFKTGHNFWVQLFIALIAFFLGVFLKISHIEWTILVLSMGSVLVAETFNTAIEIDIDLTSPDHHPYARDTKDVSAGAVLLSSFVALIIGLIIFIPKIILLF